MVRLPTLDAIRSRTRHASLYLHVAVLIGASLAPLISVSKAEAAQLTSRSVAISTSAPSATGVGYVFKFSWGEATAVRGAIMQFCTTPLGTCTLPTGMNVSAATVDGSTGFPGGALSTTKNTASAGECTAATGAAATMVCLTSASVTSGTGTDATISLGGITNPQLVTTPGQLTTIYARVTLYAAAGFTSPVHAGTVAAAINRQLTVSGRVQERLLFCVAAATDGSALPANLPACAAITDTNIDLGVIDNSTIAKSPVANNPPSSQGNARYGIAMVNTNASNGVAVTYFAEPDTTSGAAEQLRAFRVPGASCQTDATAIVDQCFRSAAANGSSTMTAGSELFGLEVPCILASTGGAAVDGITSTTKNLVANAAYSGTDANTDPVTNCQNTEVNTKYSWNPTSAATEIANSATVVDNELIKLNFAATASATTPTGAYTVRSTYIATPRF